MDLSDNKVLEDLLAKAVSEITETMMESISAPTKEPTPTEEPIEVIKVEEPIEVIEVKVPIEVEEPTEVTFDQSVLGHLREDKLERVE